MWRRQAGWLSSRIDRERFESSRRVASTRVFTAFSPSARCFLPVSPVLEANFRCIDMSARFHYNHHYHVLVFIVSKKPRLVSLGVKYHSDLMVKLYAPRATLITNETIKIKHEIIIKTRKENIVQKNLTHRFKYVYTIYRHDFCFIFTYRNKIYIYIYIYILFIINESFILRIKLITHTFICISHRFF